jgi:hypothetical protein
MRCGLSPLRRAASISVRVIDRAHQFYAMRCKEPGLGGIAAVLMLTPRPVGAVMQRWAT